MNGCPPLIDPAEKLVGMWPGASLVQGNRHPGLAQSPMGNAGGAPSQESAGQPPPVRDNQLEIGRNDSNVYFSLISVIN